ncbi:MAG: hypothetical protein Q9218_003630 [Villophora microphyllina]
MTATTTPAISPQCLGLLRRLAGIRSVESRFPFHQQIRGKKKSNKGPHPVTVRLLEDIQGYGRKGSIIPVAPGRMRNIYYPQRKAEYVTQAQMRSMNQKDMVIERDFSFGLERPQETAAQAEEKITAPRLTLLTPQRSAEVLEALVPPELVFYRVPIVTPVPEPEPPKPLGNSINVIGGEASVQRVPPPELAPAITRIFGSVTTADIVDSVKAVLAENEEGARVVIGPEDIRMVDTANEEDGIEADRLKAVGEFGIEIRLKGVEPIRRVVSIRPQETDHL